MAAFAVSKEELLLDQLIMYAEHFTFRKAWKFWTAQVRNERTLKKKSASQVRGVT